MRLGNHYIRRLLLRHPIHIEHGIKPITIIATVARRAQPKTINARLTSRKANFTTSPRPLHPKTNQLPPRPTLPDTDLKHKYLKGSGPGGQKINKTSSAVQLTHLPTGIVVKSQATRSRSQNHTIAKRILAEKIELLEKGDESRAAKVVQRLKKKKASADKKKRRKYRRLSEEAVAAAAAEGGEEEEEVARDSEERHRDSEDVNIEDVKLIDRRGKDLYPDYKSPKRQEQKI